MTKLPSGHVYIEVSRNVNGGLSLCVSDDDGGYRISGAKVGGCETLKRFVIDADELINAINDHRRKGDDHA